MDCAIEMDASAGPSGPIREIPGATPAPSGEQSRAGAVDVVVDDAVVVVPEEPTVTAVSRSAWSATQPAAVNATTTTTRDRGRLFDTTKAYRPNPFLREKPRPCAGNSRRNGVRLEG
jgi:hypothetical protein